MSSQNTHVIVCKTNSVGVEHVEYRDCPDYPGYRVGSDGTVWSCWRSRWLGIGIGTASYLSERWRLLTPCVGRDGYSRVNLRRQGRGRHRMIHRLVLEAFVGPCPDGQECCHYDGDRRNNRLNNLRWDTNAANVADRIRHGRTIRGTANHKAKLSDDDVRTIRRLLAETSLTMTEIAERFGVTRGLIGHINIRRVWKHLDAEQSPAQFRKGRVRRGNQAGASLV